MSFSSGTFSLVTGNPVATGTTISSTTFNNTMSDIATGLTTCLLKDGTQTATAAIPFAQGISVGTNWVIDASGNLAVTTNKFTVTASSGNTLIAGTLAVTGASTLTGATNVVGDFSVNTNKFTVTAASGNTAVAGTLGVTGAATFSSTIKGSSSLFHSNTKYAAISKSADNGGGTATVSASVTLTTGSDWSPNVVLIRATANDSNSAGASGAWWQYRVMTLDGSAGSAVVAASGGDTGNFSLTVSGNSGTGTQVWTLSVAATNLDYCVASYEIASRLGITALS